MEDRHHGVHLDLNSTQHFERNPKLYLVESEVPRVKSYLGLRKAREQPESAVMLYSMHRHVVYNIHSCNLVEHSHSLLLVGWLTSG